MNERDKALGRLLLQRNLCSREALQQAGQTTLARRQAGQQAEIVVVLVEMGVLTTDVGRQLWAEVAAIPTDAASPTTASFPRPVAPSGSPEFMPVSTLSAMGQAAPAGYDPVGARGFGPANGLGNGAYGPPPASPVASDEIAIDDVAPVGGGFGAASPGGFGSGSFGAPGGSGTFGAPPGLDSAPTLRGQFANMFEPDGGSGGFGGGFGASGFGAFGAAPAAPADGFGGFGPPPPMPANDGFGGFGPPPPMPGNDGFGGFGAPPPAPGADGFGGFGAPGAAPGADGFGGFGAPPPAPGADGFGGFGAPPPAPGAGGFGGFGAPGADGFGGFGAAAPPPEAGGFGGFGAPAAPPGADGFGGFGAPLPEPAPGGFGAPLPPEPAADQGTKGSQRGSKKGGSGRATTAGASSARVGRARPGAAPPRGGGAPVALIAVCVVVGVAAVGGAAYALRGKSSAAPPTTTTSTATPPPTTTTTTTSTEAPGDDRPAGTGVGGKTTKLVAPDKPPATKAETDAQSWQWADELLIQAWDLREAERYDDAIKVLEGFPAALRGGEGYLKVQEKLAEYGRFSGYKRKLEEAIAAGGGSEALRALVGRIEAGQMETDLLALPCTTRFKDEARRALGPAVYDEIAVKAMDIPTEIPSGED